jgi:hypothetical protein
MLVEQRPCVFEIGGVEALREPAVDVGEHRASFVAAALFPSTCARLILSIDQQEQFIFARMDAQKSIRLVRPVEKRRQLSSVIVSSRRDSD